MEGLQGPTREAVVLGIAEKVKVCIVGKDYTLTELILASTAATATPMVHSVIADECIRLGVSRDGYRNVVRPAYNRIRDAIKWVDAPGALFCPKWGDMKIMMDKEMRKGPNKGVHTMKPNWRVGGDGCVWTEVNVYIEERLIAYRSQLPDTYRNHLRTIDSRVRLVDETLPDLCAAVRVPIDLQDRTKLQLVVMADGALLYRRSKIKVAMSQTEFVATVLNDGVQSGHTQIPFFLYAKGDTLRDHLENAGYDLIQRYTTNDFTVKMPQEYPGAATRIAQVVALVGDSKWLWSVFGVIQNWSRPVSSGPFTTDQVNQPGVHLPVVYDRQFYRDVFEQYVQLVNKARGLTSVFVPNADGTLDPRRQKQQFEMFCAEHLGFRVEEISNLAVHFGWEAAWVGPLHATAAAIKQTYAQWLTIYHTLGRQRQFEDHLHKFKIDVRTMLRYTPHPLTSPPFLTPTPHPLTPDRARAVQNYARRQCGGMPAIWLMLRLMGGCFR